MKQLTVKLKFNLNKVLPPLQKKGEIDADECDEHQRR